MSKPQFKLRLVERPLERLTLAERRIKQIEPRDFKADPWMRGEGPKFYTPARVAAMARDNEKLRADRAKRTK